MRALVGIVALAGCDQIYGLDDRIAPDASPDAYARAVLDDSPSAYYRLGETLGVECMDVIGGPAGTYAGTFALGSPGAVFDDPDTAVMFGPGDTGVLFGDIHEFAGTDAFSIEAWVNVTDDTRFNNIVAKYAEPPIATGYVLYAKEGQLTFARGVTQANQSLVVYDNFDTNRFVYVVATYDGTSMRLYIDGALQSENTSAIALPDQAVGFTIGSGNGSITSAPMEGVLDEVAIYPGALPATRVSEHFLVGRTPPI